MSLPATLKLSRIHPALPSVRWLLAGPPGSGTNFHVDPNYTSAWNTVVVGAKKWIMFPPEVLPPGVEISDDGCQVLQAENVKEWFIENYESIHAEGSLWKQHVVECVCYPGETAFIPAGWWHLVLNLETTIAITQNYVSESNLGYCLEFLKTDEPGYMNHAGPPDLGLRFRNALLASKHACMLKAQPSEGTKASPRPSLWSNLTQCAENASQQVETGQGFKFGFL